MMNPSAAEAELTDPQVILSHYQKMQMEAQQLAGKLNEFETELNEHEQVLQQLRPLETDRRAYRLIGGVLVERSVGDVIPVLSQTSEKLKVLIMQFREAFEKKEIEVRAWKEKYNIRAQTAKEIRAQAQEAQHAAAGKAAATGGGSAAGGGILA